MDRQARIYVAGAQTLIGASILGELKQQRYINILNDQGRDPDLTKVSEVDAFFRRTEPQYVFLAAGRSAGIGANQAYPADLMLHNLLVDCNVIHSAHLYEVKKLVYFASSCAYPKHCPQPMREESLLTGPLEPTSEAYAVAKISGIMLCRAHWRQYGANYVSAIPADAFGPGDDFSPGNSHVVAALIRRMHEAKELGEETVDIWGTGTARREFICAEDLASASVFVMREYSGADPINLGCGEDLSIGGLATLVKDVVGYHGQLRFDKTKPDGMPRKLLDSRKLRMMGWQPRTSFRAALANTYDWFRKNHGEKSAQDARELS